MRRLWIIIATAALAGAGCDRSGSGSNPGLPKQIRIGYFANLTHAQAVIGADSGQFAQAIAPVALQTRVFNAGPSLVEALFAGEIDIGYVGPGPAINAFGKSRGKGVRVVAGAAANGSLIVARKDSGISTLADLKGKKVATPQLANTQDISARHYLISVLKQADASNVTPISNAEQSGMMARGQIDAAWCPEPWGSRLVQEVDAKVIAHEKDVKELWPGGELALTVVITTPEFMKKHPDVLAKVLAVHRRMTQRLQKEPEKCIPELDAALFKLMQKRLPEGLLGKAIANVRFTEDPLEETLRSMAQWSFELGFAREQTSIEGLVDLSVLKGLGQ